MPSHNKAVCTYPGCNRLVLGHGRCDNHPYPKHNRRTQTTAEMGYDGKWQRVRIKYLHHHPRCEYRFKCDGAKATEVDHVVTLANGGTNEWRNLRSCCKPCHSFKTATQDRTRTGGKFNGSQKEGKQESTHQAEETGKSSTERGEEGGWPFC